jgi:hypothetical protein
MKSFLGNYLVACQSLGGHVLLFKANNEVFEQVMQPLLKVPQDFSNFDMEIAMTMIFHRPYF